MRHMKHIGILLLLAIGPCIAQAEAAEREQSEAEERSTGDADSRNTGEARENAASAARNNGRRVGLPRIRMPVRRAAPRRRLPTS